jgi:hypothetical protein
LSFTIQQQGSAPVTPTPLTPIDTITITAPIYRWSAVAGATSYYLWVNGAGILYSASAAGCNDGTSTCTVTGAALALGSYTWWIQAINSYGSSAWSNGLSFTISTALTGFDEQFKSNPAGWAQTSGYWMLSGSEYWYTQGVAGNSSTSLYTIANFSNLDVSTRFFRASSSLLQANMLLVRSTVATDNGGLPLNAYAFEYAGTGQFAVWKYLNGVQTPIQDWTYTSAINTGSAFNTLRAYASGANLYYWINGTLVWSGTDTSLTSGKVGVTMFRNSTSTDNGFWVDYVTLRPVAGAAALSEAVSVQQMLLNEQARAGAANAGPGQGTATSAP